MQSSFIVNDQTRMLLSSRNHNIYVVYSQTVTYTYLINSSKEIFASINIVACYVNTLPLHKAGGRGKRTTNVKENGTMHVQSPDTICFPTSAIGSLK